MKNQNPICPKCASPATQYCENVVASNPTGRVIGGECVERIFISREHPEHGPFPVAGVVDGVTTSVTGHHSTNIETRMRKLFPEEIRKHLLEKLEPDERKEFMEVWRGKRIVDEKRIARWRQLAQ